MPKLSAGVDIGGTKIIAGVVDADGVVLAIARAATPSRAAKPSTVESTIAALVEELRSSYDLACLGVAAAGFVQSDGVVAFAPHLPWRHEPLGAGLAGRLGLPVVVDNDANATAVAELTFGSAQGSRDFVCVTLGTGIGGAVVLDGRIRRGAHGFSGEFGHWPVEPEGRPCPCGQRGCWEQYCSGTALLRAVAAENGGRIAPAGEEITGAALRGEPRARTAFEEIGQWLGHGLAGVCAALDPELVVVGGGVAEAGDLLLEPARVTLARKLVGVEHRPVPAIRKAHLGQRAGLVGAAVLARAAVTGRRGG